MKKNIKKSVILFIFHHLLDKKKSEHHRLLTGLTIMLIGVSLTKVVLIFDSVLIHTFADTIGYGLHALGSVPFVDIFLISND